MDKQILLVNTIVPQDFATAWFYVKERSIPKYINAIGWYQNKLHE